MFGKPAWLYFWFSLASSAAAGVCAANDCEPVDRQASINKVLADHAGGKVLKVDERIDGKGCVELEIRILINGTVKAVVISGNISA